MSQKKFTFAHPVFFILIFFTLSNSQAQWLPDIRLTNDPATSITSDNNARCLVSNGEAIHIVWSDDRDGNFEIYYKQSLDGGNNWGTDTRLTNNSAGSLLPSVCVEGTVIHVVWQDYRDGNYEIYYIRSTDEGISWSDNIRLTDYYASSRNPSVTVNDSNVHVVWRDNRDGNYEIYYKHSTDAGMNWESDVRLTDNPNDSYNPSITLSDSLVHVAWQDDRDGNNEIYHKLSTDGGTVWGSDTRLTFNVGISYNPVITFSPTALHLVFRDSRDGEYDIFYMRSLDEGITWSTERRLTQNTADSLVFSVAASDSAVHLVWEDDRDGNYEIYYKRSLNAGATWEQDTRLTNNPGFSFYAFVAASDSVVHVVWYDNRDGNNEIYYKRNQQGNSPIPVQNISTESPGKFSLMQNYPNPFNPKTIINYSIPNSQYAILKVYDALGSEVAVLVNENQSAGSYSVEFDGSNLSSGIYFYKLSTVMFSQVKRMILLK